MKLGDYFQAINDQSAAYGGPPPQHILLYGPPKSGKTAAWGKLAQRFKLRVFDLESSVKTLRNPKFFDPAWMDNVELISIPDTQLFPMGIETILKVIKYGHIKICYKHGKQNCPQCKEGFTEFDMDPYNPDTHHIIYVLDSYTQLVNSALNYIMRDSVKKDDFDAKPGWDEWGKLRRIMERIDSTIQVSPFNWVVTSHDMMVEMEDKSKKVVPVGGTENASRVFGRYWDEIVYCEISGNKHKLTSTTTGKVGVLAGSRTGVELGPEDTLLKFFEGY